MFGSIKSIFSSKSLTSLYTTSNNAVNQIRTITTYKPKTKSACAKRFMLTKVGNVKFHPRSHPGKVYFVTGTPVIKTFRNSLFAQNYSRSHNYPLNGSLVEVTDIVEEVDQ